MVEMPNAETPIDLKINVGDTQFKFRVSALVILDGRLLTTAMDFSSGQCYLPGGKVQLGETAREAMRRELQEEVGHDFPVDDPVLIAESLYDRSGGLHQQLVFYFHVKVPAALTAEDLTSSPEEDHELRWIPLDQLRAAGLRPPDIIDELPGLDDSRLRHLVFDHRP
jgi:8-oxo-dGTP pyrophosphatase MutT (NUDIX family)